MDKKPATKSRTLWLLCVTAAGVVSVAASELIPFVSEFVPEDKRLPIIVGLHLAATVAGIILRLDTKAEIDRWA